MVKILSIFCIFCSSMFVTAKGETTDIICRGNTEKKYIALTFDDGPRPKYTQQILDILKKNKAKGTFFCLGSEVKKYPKVAKRIVKEKHEIANHTFNHRMLVRLKSSKVKEEIYNTQNLIRSITGVKTKLFRPPGGSFNRRTINLVKKTKHTLVLWSSDQETKDWRKPGVNRIVNKVIKNASNGDIVLLHDTNAQTVRALRIIIPILKKKGYKMVTVSEILKGRKN